MSGVQELQLAEIAHQLRRHAITQARGGGQAYFGQALQSAELCAALFFGEMNWAPDRLDDPDRDHFFLSVGHAAIAFYSVLAQFGVLDDAQLATYGADGAALTLGGEPGSLPGMEFAGGSLGQGLSFSAGFAYGLRLQGRPGRVFNYMSDGEVQEGATWEAAMFAGAKGLANLINVVDVNRTQADGPLSLEIEPLAEKYRAFGWWAQDVDGHDLDALADAFAAARTQDDRPKALVVHTRLAEGSPTVQARGFAHFVRIGSDEWDQIADEIEAGRR